MPLLTQLLQILTRSFVVIRDVNDKFMYLTGNQSAALLLDYIAKTKLEFGQKIAGKIFIYNDCYRTTWN